MSWQRLAADAENGVQTAGEALLRQLKRAGFDKEASLADRALWRQSAPDSMREATDRTTMFHTLDGARFLAHLPSSFAYGTQWDRDWPEFVSIDEERETVGPEWSVVPLGRFTRRTFKRVKCGSIPLGTKWFEYFEVPTDLNRYL